MNTEYVQYIKQTNGKKINQMLHGDLKKCINSLISTGIYYVGTVAEKFKNIMRCSD